MLSNGKKANTVVTTADGIPAQIRYGLNLPFLLRVLSIIIPRSGPKNIPITVAIRLSFTRSPFLSPNAAPARRLVAESPI